MCVCLRVRVHACVCLHVCVCVCVCVCVYVFALVHVHAFMHTCLRSCYMAFTINIIYGHGLSNKVCHENLPRETKVLL